MTMFGSSWIADIDDTPIGRPILDDYSSTIDDIMYATTEGEEDFTK